MCNKATDRYGGYSYPDVETACSGQCEGTGVVPIYMSKGDRRQPGLHPEDETDEAYIKLWEEAEAKSPANDGWHFVECPDCGGTGKEPSGQPS